MADVELLPLPECDVDYTVSYSRGAMHAYARANLAPLQAENERLRAEVARREMLLETALGTIEAGNMYREAMCNEMRAAGCKVVATPDTIEVRNTRAERLAEALRKSRQFVAYAYDQGIVEAEDAGRELDAALCQEHRNG